MDCKTRSIDCDGTEGDCGADSLPEGFASWLQTYLKRMKFV